MSYIRHFINLELNENVSLPTELFFSFRKLITWWEQQTENPDPLEAQKAIEVLKHISEFPQLAGVIADHELETYQSQIEMLLKPFFPPISTRFDFKAAGIPFKTMFFNPTERFGKLIDASEGDVRISMKDKDMMYVFACMVVLNGYYKAGINFLHDLHFDFHDKKTGILHRFLSKINAEFVDVFPNGNAKELTTDDINDLLAHFED